MQNLIVQIDKRLYSQRSQIKAELCNGSEKINFYIILLQYNTHVFNISTHTLLRF